MKHQVRIDLTTHEPPTLYLLRGVLDGMAMQGAPHAAVIVLTMGDKGSQRDPEPYLRAITAKWETP